MVSYRVWMVFMKKFKWILLCVIMGTALLLATAVMAQAEQRQLSRKLIRFHVIANSDTETDQSLKLQVRDAVLAFLDQEHWEDLDEARLWLNDNLLQLERIANAKLLELGSSQTATARLVREEYPTRHYDSFSLPAGEYESLQIILGEGEGKNWWCVVYPAICRKASGAMETAAVSSGFKASEVTLITEDTVTVRVKFKLLEVFRKIRIFLQDT